MHEQVKANFILSLEQKLKFKLLSFIIPAPDQIFYPDLKSNGSTLLLKCTILFYLVYIIITHKYYMCCFFLPVALARANLLYVIGAK